MASVFREEYSQWQWKKQRISLIYFEKQELKPANATKRHQLESNDIVAKFDLRDTGRRSYQLDASDGSNWTGAKERWKPDQHS